MNSLKRILSYLIPQSVRQSRDLHGDPVYVDIYRGRLRLSTDKAVYSFDDLYDNFFQVFKKIDLSRFQDSEILILGGGLGSVPYMLEKKFGLKAAYTIIEYDVHIIELFNQFTNPRMKSQISFINLDAEIAVNILEEKYALIIIDLFDHDEIPNQFKSLEFLEDCHKLMEKQGLILFNWLTINNALLMECNEYQNNVFKTIFNILQLTARDIIPFY